VISRVLVEAGYFDDYEARADVLRRVGSLADFGISAPPAADRFPDSDQDQRPTFRPHPHPVQREVDGTVE